jgi:hypothetical protein
MHFEWKLNTENGIVWILARYLRHHPTSDRHLGVAMIIDRSAILRRAHRLLFFRVRWRTAGIPSEPYETPMKRFFALALAAFLGLGLLSTSFPLGPIEWAASRVMQQS